MLKQYCGISKKLVCIALLLWRGLGEVERTAENQTLRKVIYFTFLCFKRFPCFAHALNNIAGNHRFLTHYFFRRQIARQPVQINAQ